MVFAAGYGTRMAPLTLDTPKPLLRVGGIPLLDHALAHRKGLGITTTVVNAHYKYEMIREHIAGLDAHVSVELPDILDTGGGLKAAAPMLGSGPTYTLNADVVWLGPNPLEILRSQWIEGDALALLLLVPISSTHNRVEPGDFGLQADGTISRGGDYVYTGAQIVDASLASEFEPNAFSLNIIWDQLIGAGKLEAVVYPGEWCDVGTLSGLNGANELWANYRHG